nr:S-layer homology domain-containing protein [Chengkuizengella sediminis]
MNANLSGLTVSEGTLSPTFDPDTIEYGVFVANEITSIKVTPTIDHEKANATIEGSPNDLKVGDNTIKVIVTSEDGIAIKTYTITVTREKNVPSAPTEIIATAGKNGKATVQFTAPTDDGGSEITGYEVSASPGNIKVIGTESPMTITGLSNSRTYTFTVKAINSVGKSEASEKSNAVSPRSTSSGGSNSGGSNDDNTEDETEKEITIEEELTSEEKFEALKVLGIFSGYSDGLPYLEDQMTREQAAKIIVLLFGLDLADSSQDAQFTDVDKEHWSYPYIEAASKAGIIHGVGNGRFNPTGNITYEQFIKMVVEGYASMKGLEIDETEQVNTGYASDWAEKYVIAAIQWELIEDRENYRLIATREFLVEAAYTMVQILHE